MRWVLRFVLAALLRVRVSGLDNMPGGTAGFIIAGAPHRNWVEVVIVHAYVAPRRRRVVTVADARAVNSAVRRFAVRLVGGVIAVGPGTVTGSTADRLNAARDVVGRGDIVLIFPEIGHPARPPDLRRFSAGLAYMAAISGGPVVPVVFGGTDELYLGRRIEIAVLPPLSPPPDTSRSSIVAWMGALRASMQAATNSAQLRANAIEPRRKYWKWLSGNYPRS